jgi:DNA-binding transcriptional regulator GbsR (MarR family)
MGGSTVEAEEIMDETHMDDEKLSMVMKRCINAGLVEEV